VHAAAVRFDLHIPESRSLKVKRAAIRPIVDGLRHRYHVSVAEIDHQDQWQRAEIGVALIAESDGHLRHVLDEVERFVARASDVEVLDVEVVHLDGEGTLGPGAVACDGDQKGRGRREAPGGEAAESGRG
jgi:uncharacterized protein YlxP (DUF503 family)